MGRSLLVRTNLAFFICVSFGYGAQIKNHKIVIGGWVVDGPEILSNRYSLLFETYLTEVVGSTMEPPVEFILVPIDYTEGTSLERNLNSLDMMCE